MLFGAVLSRNLDRSCYLVSSCAVWYGYTFGYTRSCSALSRNSLTIQIHSQVVFVEVDGQIVVNREVLSVTGCP